MKLKSTIQSSNLSIIDLILIKSYRFLRYIITELKYSFLVKFGRRHGTTIKKRPLPLVVCLTTIPERINKIHLCVESILRQSIKPDHIVLWISDAIYSNRSNNLDDCIPKKLLHLKNRGLEIHYCKEIGPFTKTINSLKYYDNCLLIVADDDVYYPKDWLLDLYNSYKKEPQYIYCHQARWMKKNTSGKLNPYNNWKIVYDYFQGPSFNISPVTKGGCIYPPNSLSKELFNEKIFLELCPIQDDVWLAAMSPLQGVRCKKVRPFPIGFIPIRGTQVVSLLSENILNDKNDPQIQAVFDKYNLYHLLE